MINQNKNKTKESKSKSNTVENAYRANKETIKLYQVSKEFIDMTMNGD